MRKAIQCGGLLCLMGGKPSGFVIFSCGVMYVLSRLVVDAAARGVRVMDAVAKRGPGYAGMPRRRHLVTLDRPVQVLDIHNKSPCCRVRRHDYRLLRP